MPLLYYEQPYYLAPGKGGDKVYALLRETLRKAGKIGIATVVIRVKQHLAALVCVGDTIVLNTLRFADEIRETDELKIPTKSAKTAAVSDKELKMAMALVEGMSEEWKPEQYHDTYREDVLALVEKKVKAKETKIITMPGKEAARPASSNVVDLVALLQQSIGKKPGKAAAARRKPAEAEDDDEPPPPRKARKPSAANDEEEAPAAKPRKVAAKSTRADCGDGGQAEEGCGCEGGGAGQGARAGAPQVGGLSRWADWIDLLQWPAMAVTLYAAYLIGSKREDRRIFGFSMFILSNVLWVAWGWHDEAWALIALQVGLFAMNVRGIVKNEE